MERALLAARDELFHAGEGDPVPRTLPDLTPSANSVSWADAFVAMAERSLGERAASRPHHERHMVLLHVGTGGDGTTAGHLHLGPGLSEGLRRFVSCDARIRPVIEAGGKAVSVGRAFRSVPERTRVVIEERDRGCRVPGCDRSRWLHIHHIEHWEDGGASHTSNLLALCRKHHRLHHLGHLGISGNADDPNGVLFTDHQGHPLDSCGRPVPPRQPVMAAARELGIPHRDVVAPHRRAPGAGGGLLQRTRRLTLPVPSEVCPAMAHGSSPHRTAPPRRPRVVRGRVGRPGVGAPRLAPFTTAGVRSWSVDASRAGGPMPSADEIRAVQRAAWAGLSASWEKWDSLIMDQLGPVGATIIEHLDIVPEQQHLDIASGTGEPGLSIAKLAPKGRVVLTDLSAEMLEVAARRAQTQGIATIQTQVCSADDLPFDAATFDSVSVRFGYMFFPDMGRATAEFERVLKPGGRLCSSVWVKPQDNPWTTILMQAIGTEAVVPPPDPDAPNMFRCAAPGYVTALYEAAGLRDLVEWDVEVELVTQSPEQYWEMMSEHVSLAVAALQQVDHPARERIRARAIAEVRAFEKDGMVRVPGLARCIAGTKRDAGSL